MDASGGAARLRIQRGLSARDRLGSLPQRLMAPQQRLDRERNSRRSSAGIFSRRGLLVHLGAWCAIDIGARLLAHTSRIGHQSFGREFVSWRHVGFRRKAAGASPSKDKTVAKGFASTLQAGPASSFLFRSLLVLVFIIVDVGQALTMDWAEKRTYMKGERGDRQYARQTVLVTNSMLCIASGIACAFAYGGFRGVLELVDPKCALAFLPVSFCFALGLSLKMMAVNYFHAGTIKVCGQFRLPLVAIFSAILLHRRYSAVQWQVIAIITVSCLSFVLLKGQGRSGAGKEIKWKGYLQLLTWVVLNVLGGIAAESAYKRVDRPFYVQKASEDVGHLAVSLIMLYIVVPRTNPSEDVRNRELRPGGYFDSWDIRTCTVVFFLYIDTWIGNLLIKHCSGLTRSIAKAFSIAAVYMISLMYSKDRKSNPSLTLVAFLVIQSSLLFSFV
mmetsp:Transcript_8237/g.18411  ORF Transcript_8237/g.18411 Transcript_8237/m.18411 type:complete len:444 (-) Transcript_8237:85-1416(-)